jgi:diphthamide biosynthesis methyltransferase
MEVCSYLFNDARRDDTADMIGKVANIGSHTLLLLDIDLLVHNASGHQNILAATGHCPDTWPVRNDVVHLCR